MAVVSVEADQGMRDDAYAIFNHVLEKISDIPYEVEVSMKYMIPSSSGEILAMNVSKHDNHQLVLTVIIHGNTLTSVGFANMHGDLNDPISIDILDAMIDEFIDSGWVIQ